MREYFLHYHCAAAGADPDADRAARLIHRLKNLDSIETYTARLCAETLRELFAARRSTFAAMIFSRYRREVNSMLTGRAGQDHGLPLLRELYYDELPLEKCLDEVKERLEKFASGLEKAEEFHALLKLDPLAVTIILAPAEFRLGETILYSTPLLAAREGNRMIFWECATPESFAYRAMFHRYYGAGTMRFSLNRISSRFIAPDGTISDFPESKLEITAALDGITSHTAREKELSAFSGATPFALPGSGQCSGCRFRDYCRNN